jgi:hypothetical protein
MELQTRDNMTLANLRRAKHPEAAGKNRAASPLSIFGRRGPDLFAMTVSNDKQV